MIGLGRGSRTDEIDEAGIAHVLAYEQAAGRNPVEMPHDNPGYDIESKNADGEVVRIIEVKSKLGPWSSRDVELSARQMLEAQRRGAQFWLYVVENAPTDSAHVFAISDPASRITKFVFDEGWATVAERESTGIEADELTLHARVGTEWIGEAAVPVFESAVVLGSFLAGEDPEPVAILSGSPGRFGSDMSAISFNGLEDQFLIVDRLVPVELINRIVVIRHRGGWDIGSVDEMDDESMLFSSLAEGCTARRHDADDVDIFGVVVSQVSLSVGVSVDG